MNTIIHCLTLSLRQISFHSINLKCKPTFMFRLKLGFYMHALVGSTSLLDFFGGAFVVKDCSFDQKRQVSCCSFVKFS